MKKPPVPATAVKKLKPADQTTELPEEDMGSVLLLEAWGVSKTEARQAVESRRTAFVPILNLFLLGKKTLRSTNERLRA